MTSSISILLETPVVVLTGVNCRRTSMYLIYFAKGRHQVDLNPSQLSSKLWIESHRFLPRDLIRLKRIYNF
jgi:hypothetical protein